MKEIYFAGGCFWGTQAFFDSLKGVQKTFVGYANSRIENPNYKQVCTGETGAVETVKVIYDENETSIVELIKQMFSVVDPTAYNHQGEDYGTQYRNGVYYIDDSEHEIIANTLTELAKNYNKKIVTENLKLQNFTLAEDYHQDYLKKNPNGYCHIKIKK
ncbi:peptide-methionine (S)-S-oxide reductase MsrA [Mycoplasmopsis caviae]|uniref:Peptide methionine sulfoxide reductase MsrA n=1 Tax=Mycoplasmopsis caviae TaxID=55603 RepID=A0A3P8LAR2_9BACT|nr:peptide-methionine (S)-S-oxide reductase MsrA [Mycoplasmopsis caviae]UUD35264.1 peptide-methionine (S)-S-oxide reductase MsrA [Mycoplasmopsis caviae]VDR41951.1 peptide-methionine (S)-S-oxide reductase [Mycoplasmopsis caviae]